MGMDQILINFSNSTSDAIWMLIWALGELLGFLTVGFELKRLAKANSDPSKPPLTIGDSIPILITGSLMFNLKAIINSTWKTFSDTGVSFDPIAYDATAPFPFLSTGVNAALTLMAAFGGVFFLKGLLCIKKGSVEGQASNHSNGGDLILKGLTHMIGGVLLINSTKVLDALYVSIS